jgi:hypothetical protein
MKPGKKEERKQNPRPHLLAAPLYLYAKNKVAVQIELIQTKQR